MYHITLINPFTFELDAGIDNFIENDFKYPTSEMVWDWRLKKHKYVSSVGFLFHNRYGNIFTFKIGWLPYIYYHYYAKLDEESRQLFESCKNDMKVNFDNLYDSQNEDLNYLLSMNRGIATIYTGYGKTECLATLINWIINTRNETVLIIVPGDAAKKEIVDRLEDKYGITTPYFDYSSNYNCIAVNGFLRSYQYDKSHPYWKTVDWIIADEVEYTVTNAGIECIELCTNVKWMYGFSATPDKKEGARITILPKNNKVVQRNSRLIDYFGFSTVYKKPTGHDIKLVKIQTTQFNYLDVDKIKDTGYSEIVETVLMDPRICNLIKKVSMTHKSMFIPINRLEIIDEWIHSYFTDDDVVVINLCGRGFEVYNSGVHIGNIDLRQVKEYLADGRVHVITGTKTAFRALDFQELNNVLPLSSSLASNVLQYIGRISRKRKYNIYQLECNRYIPVYTNDLKKRNTLIKNYYSDCNIIQETRREVEYGIF